jgi:hypothetical protein
VFPLKQRATAPVTPARHREENLLDMTNFACVLILTLALGGTAAQAGPRDSCSVKLSVTLTPDVPNPADDEFLSSLLSNNTGYELTLREQPGSAVVIVELTGPGPAYRCRNVVEAMRKDARVISVDYVS